MSTRSEVLITTKDGETYKYYHHYDGYLSGVGMDLIEKISNNPEAFKAEILLNAVLTRDYEKESLDIDHVDSEYFYVVVSNDNGITVWYKNRHAFEENWGEKTKLFFMKYNPESETYKTKYILESLKEHE